MCEFNISYWIIKTKRIKEMKNLQHLTVQKLILLIVSITQIISPAFSSFENGTDAENTDPQFTPAGYTFAIWGVITFLALCYGIYQILPNRRNEALHQQINSKLIFLYLLFSAWLFAYTKDWIIFTVIIFLGMFYLAYSVFQQIIPHRNQLTKYEKFFLEAQVGLYLGWSSFAIFANTGAALKFYGISDLGTSGIIWQSMLLVGALINTIYMLYKTKANYFYGGTIIWAFVGVFFGLRGESNTVFLQILTISAFCTFLAFFYRFNKTNLETA
jgi:hypothetical protein